MTLMQSASAHDHDPMKTPFSAVRRLAPKRIDAVYASHLTRAVQTAAPLAAPRGLTVESIEDRSLGLIQPDVARSGGITETWRIAELAQSFGVAYAPHVGWSGAVCVAASLQLAAAAENCITFECMVYENPLREKLLTRSVGDPATMKDGRLPIPDGPGLGIAIDPDALASYRIEG